MSGLKSYGSKCSKQGQPTGSWDLPELGDHPYDDADDAHGQGDDRRWAMMISTVSITIMSTSIICNRGQVLRVEGEGMNLQHAQHNHIPKLCVR